MSSQAVRNQQEIETKVCIERDEVVASKPLADSTSKTSIQQESRLPPCSSATNNASIAAPLRPLKLLPPGRCCPEITTLCPFLSACHAHCWTHTSTTPATALAHLREFDRMLMSQTELS